MEKRIIFPLHLLDSKRRMSTERKKIKEVLKAVVLREDRGVMTPV